MDFQLNSDQTMIRDTAREFAQSKIAGVAARHDETEEFPKDIVAGLSELGFMGMFVPEAYGGAGTDHVSYTLAIDEISQACAATGVIISVNNSLVCQPILDWATEEQKQRFLPKLARGQWMGAFALSEPDNGSDAAAMKTTARRDGDHYVISGRKNYITNGPQADVVIIFAKSNADAGHRGVTAFLVEKTMAGYEVGAKDRKLGIRASHSSEILLSDVRVPVANRLGEEGQGFKVAMKTLDGGRIGIAAQACGILAASLVASAKYSQERKAFGKPISELQAIQWFLADMKVALDAARLLTQRAAFLQDRGEDFTQAAAQAKLFASEASVKGALAAVQVHGGAGYMRDFPVERYLRDAKVTEIYEGTSEIQRLVIASKVLKGQL